MVETFGNFLLPSLALTLKYISVCAGDGVNMYLESVKSDQICFYYCW